MTNIDSLIILDVNGLFFRSFYALPKEKFTHDGKSTNALYGLTKTIKSLPKQLKLKDNFAIVGALDSQTKNLERTKECPEYKIDRPEAPDELKEQFQYLRSLLEAYGVNCLKNDGYEADDVIASICAQNKDKRCYVVSVDKDMMQLLDMENVSIFNPIKKIHIDRNYVTEKYGVTPEKFTLYQSIVGDSVDNIKGIYRVGPKTAVKIINDNFKPEILEQHKELIDKNMKLVTLNRELVIKNEFTLSNFSKCKEFNQQFGMK